MVGGLVQNEEIDFAAHEHTELEPGALAAGERGNAFEHILPPEAEGAQPVARLLGLTLALIEHGVHHAALGVLEGDDLGQIGHAHGGAPADIAGVRRLLIHEELEKGGLPRPVVANEGDALAPGDRERHIGKERSLAEGF